MSIHGEARGERREAQPVGARLFAIRATEFSLPPIARACSHQSLVPSSLSGFHRECAGDRFLLIFGFILTARALLSSLR